MSADDLDLIFGAAERRWAFVITGWPRDGAGQPALHAVRIKVEMDDRNPNGRSADGFTVGHADVLESLPASAGAAAFIPTKAVILLDRVQFPLALGSRGSFVRDLIAHEIGHALGFGTIWDKRPGLVSESNGKKFFMGPHAVAEYAQLVPGSRGVPIESHGSSETAGKHWDEDPNDRSKLGITLLYELMSGAIQERDNRLSPLTVAAMKDLGYQVNMGAAERYQTDGRPPTF